MKNTLIYLTIILCISITTRIFSDPEPLEPLKFSTHKHEKNIEKPAPEQQSPAIAKDKHVTFAQTSTEVSSITQPTTTVSTQAATETHTIVPVQNFPVEQNQVPMKPTDNKPEPVQSTIQEKSIPHEHKNGKSKKKHHTNISSKIPIIADTKDNQSFTHVIASIVTLQAFLPDNWSTIPLYSFAPDGRFACLNKLSRTKALQGLAAIACVYGAYKVITYYCTPQSEDETF